MRFNAYYSFTQLVPDSIYKHHVMCLLEKFFDSNCDMFNRHPVPLVVIYCFKYEMYTSSS